MKIYHTSNLVVSEPDVYHSRGHLDFGEGMYLTFLEKQARGDKGQAPDTSGSSFYLFYAAKILK